MAITEPQSPGPSMPGAIPAFQVGLAYRRQGDIHKKYGGSWQNGISSSAVCPAIFVFTGETGEQYGYRDGFDAAGVFSYSGEGQVGDMQFKSGNKALRDHAQDGRAVHLFRALGKGQPCTYMGEFVVANHSRVRGPDREGNERSIIVFHLLRADSEIAIDESGAVAGASTPSTSLAEARRRAIEACTGREGRAGREAVGTLYERSNAVRDYVRLRAKGHCIGCDKPAPFIALDEQPYLEAHHTQRMSDGGPDHPRYVAAICPTCHRKVHYGREGKELNDRLIAWLQANEPAN